MTILTVATILTVVTDALTEERYADALAILDQYTPTTCREAVEVAELRAQIAEEAWLADDSCPRAHNGQCQCASWLATQAADTALYAAREYVDPRAEPRLFDLTEDGYSYDTVMASSPAEALAVAVGNVSRDNYSDAVGTIWIDVRVRCEETGEEDSDSVTLDETEPECAHASGEHDWQSPQWLGGCDENPGVWGKGGGVIITEACLRCGCARHTDTWAQRRDTGEQGLTSVSYEPGRYAEQIDAARVAAETAPIAEVLDTLENHAATIESDRSRPGCHVVAVDLGAYDLDDSRDLVAAQSHVDFVVGELESALTDWDVGAPSVSPVRHNRAPVLVTISRT